MHEQDHYVVDKLNNESAQKKRRTYRIEQGTSNAAVKFSFSFNIPCSIFGIQKIIFIN